jgi:RNA polymerase-binding transcription factor DksA
MERKRTRTGRRSKAATTPDILGNPLSAGDIPTKWRPYYRQLVKLREELRRQREALVKDAREEQPGASTHIADAATDEYDRDVVLSRLSSEQSTLYEIEEAISRIRNGRYGICEVTGKPIEPDRLRAVPWTRFSAGAETQLEANGEVDRAHLGSRERVLKSDTSSLTSDDDSL